MVLVNDNAMALQPPVGWDEVVEIESRCDDLTGVFSYSAEAYPRNSGYLLTPSLDEVTFTHIWKYPDFEEYPEWVEIRHIDAEHVISIEGRSRAHVMRDRNTTYSCIEGWVRLSLDLGKIGTEGGTVSGSRVSYLRKSVKGDLLVNMRTYEKHCSFFGLSCRNITGDYWVRYRLVKGDGGNKK